MLVLTRKLGESLIINDNIRITVVSVGAGRVKIGIEAPRDVGIQREELIVDVADDAPEGEEPAPAAPQDAAGLPAANLEKTEPAVMHNRISDKFPAPLEVPTISLAESLPTTVKNRLARYKSKPR